MANAYSSGSAVASHKSPGFSLAELMVSVSIIALMGTIVVMDLNSSKRKEELLNAARIVAADLRALQSRTQAGQNVNVCLSLGRPITCEMSTAACDDPTTCAAFPPFGYGAHFSAASTTYPFYADVDPTPSPSKDWMDTPGAGEEYFYRDLMKAGAPNVRITSLFTGMNVPEAHVGFERQNGAMHICTSSPCVAASTLTITLMHTDSGETRTVSLNAITGRISSN